jgi:hypothetical protein
MAEGPKLRSAVQISSLQKCWWLATEQAVVVTFHGPIQSAELFGAMRPAIKFLETSSSDAYDKKGGECSWWETSNQALDQ